MTTRARRVNSVKPKVVKPKVARPRKASTKQSEVKETKERAPNTRDLFPEEDRRLFDGEHPGPIWSQIKPTHYAQDTNGAEIKGVEFEHRDDSLTQETAALDSSRSRILLYFRLTSSRVMSSPIVPGQVILLINRYNHKSVKMKVQQWFQKGKYRSGHCILVPASSSSSV